MATLDMLGQMLQHSDQMCRDSAQMRRDCDQMRRDSARMRRDSAKMHQALDQMRRNSDEMHQALDQIRRNSDEMHQALAQWRRDSNQIHHEIDKQKSQLDIPNAHLYPEIIRVRTQILDQAAEVLVSTDPRYRRIWSSHGGNIIADISEITSMMSIDGTRASKWCNAFMALYGVKFTMHDKISHDRFIEVCNIRMNVQTTYPWNRLEYGGKLDKCDELLDWWEHEGDSAGFWDSPPVVKACDELIIWSKEVAFEKCLGGL